MIDEPRIYRRSPVQFILVMGLLVIFGITILRTIPRDGYIALIPFAIIIGVAFVSTLYTMIQKTTISEDGISAQTVFGEKSLLWGEISRVSGRGHGIKLHNLDGDVTVSPSSQLPGYEEVVEWIGSKRPDLFSPLEYGEMKRSWLVLTPLILVTVLFIATLVGISLYLIQTPESPTALFVILVFMLIPIVIFSGVVFFSPHSIIVDGNSLFIDFIFTKKTISADQVSLIELKYQQSRNDRSYYIAIHLKDNKKIKISLSLSPSLPIVYLVLKNWHKKNTEIGQTTQ